MPNETVWRMRFEQYTPLELVDFLLNTVRDDITRMALEELGKRLRETTTTEGEAQ